MLAHSAIKTLPWLINYSFFKSLQFEVVLTVKYLKNPQKTESTMTCKPFPT